MQRFSSQDITTNIKDLFENVNMDDILFFLKEVKLYQKLNVYMYHNHYGFPWFLLTIHF